MDQNMDQNDSQILDELDQIYQTDENNELFNYQLTDSIVHQSLQIIENNFYAQKIGNHVREWAANEMTKMIGIVFQKTDPQHSSKVPFSTPPPFQPIPNDSLARFSVPIQIKPQPQEPAPTEQRTKRTKSAKSKSSKKTQLQDSQTKNQPTTTTTTTTTSTTKKLTTKKSPLKKQSKKSHSTLEEDHQNDLKRLEKLKFQLRGKDYTYNHDEIIVIQNVNVNRLPNQNVSLNIQIDGQSVMDQPTNVQSKQESRSKKSKKKRQKSPNNQLIDEEDDHTALIGTEPMIPTHEIKPAPGVTFKDGKKVIRGDSVVDDPMMTLSSIRRSRGPTTLSQPTLNSSYAQTQEVETKKTKKRNILDEIDTYEMEKSTNIQSSIMDSRTEKSLPTEQNPSDLYESIDPVPPQSPARLKSFKPGQSAVPKGHLPYSTRLRRSTKKTAERQKLPPPQVQNALYYGQLSTYLSTRHDHSMTSQPWGESNDYLFSRELKSEGTVRSHFEEHEEEDED